MPDAVVVDLETGEVIDTVETAPTMTPDEILAALSEINTMLGVSDDESDDDDEE